MTPREKAEAYVRGKLPELMELSFGCEIKWDGSITSVLSKHDNETTGAFVKIYPQIGGCNNVYLDDNISEINSSIEIIGHPIQLQHWLRVLEPYGLKIMYGAKDLIGFMPREGNRDVFFNLTTGQPATEADYQAFNDIVGA